MNNFLLLWLQCVDWDCCFTFGWLFDLDDLFTFFIYNYFFDLFWHLWWNYELSFIWWHINNHWNLFSLFNLLSNYLNLVFNLSNGFNLFGQRLQILLDGFVLLDPWLPTIISAVHYDVSHFFHSVSQCERVSSAAVGELSEHAGSGWETLCFGEFDIDLVSGSHYVLHGNVLLWVVKDILSLCVGWWHLENLLTPEFEDFLLFQEFDGVEVNMQFLVVGFYWYQNWPFDESSELVLPCLHNLELSPLWVHFSEEFDNLHLFFFDR